VSGDAGDATIRDGLAAWVRGDLDALEQVLDPAVTLKALEPGPWDCADRDQVMSLLRLRASQQKGERSREVEVVRRDAATFVVSGLADGSGTATVVTIADGRVVSLQQISTENAKPDADAAVVAVGSGDLTALARVLAAHPDLPRVRVPGYQGRTLLHIATDWPGYLPNGPEIVRLLVDNGADPNARSKDDERGETPLHWAASSDDVDVAEALIDGGADLETPNGSIGTPLDNAIGYGCWHVARLLVARGATVDKLWHAAALGLMIRLDELLAERPATTEELSNAFWQACAGGQRRAAERLLSLGAELNWTTAYAEGTPMDAATGDGARRENVITWLRDQGARSAHQPE
jgi:hypothetical protein